MATFYEVRIGLTLPDLDVAMVGAPEEFQKIKQTEIITAGGLRVLYGGLGWRLYWRTLDPAVTYDVMSRTGGEAASSSRGFITIKDWVPRVGTLETYSKFACILDQPVEGDFDIGDLRYNLMVSARELSVVENLSYT